MFAPLLLLLAAPQAAPPPNVVLIVADDLGWGDLGCYGQELVPTPNLDRLAAEGMRFTHFFSGSTVCAPSRSVLMTGQHVGRTRIRGNARDPLLPEDVTLAERLQALGYRTALFGKWGLGEEGSTGIPTRQGFDEFIGYLNQRHAHNSYPEYLLYGETRVALPNQVPDNERWKVGEGRATKKTLHSHDVFTDAALAYVASANADEPFFLYLPYTIPHANNEAGRDGMEAAATAPFLGEAHPQSEEAFEDWPKTARDFASMLWALDRDVGRIVDLLDARGLGDNTLVLFTSDNGPHREGGHDPERFDSNGPWRGIKRALYDGGIRVPLIARWPARVAAGATSDHLSGFQDFVPTLVAAAGGDAPQGDVDGLSFLATLEGRAEAQPRHEFLYWEFHERGKAQAVRTERWKLLRFRRDGETRLELYDLEADPGEETNVVEAHPDVVQQLTTWMDGARTESERWKM